MDVRRTADRAGRVLLKVTAALGALCLLVMLACLVFDVRPVVVRSGSMEPTLATGSLAFTENVPASELEVGDIVTVPYESTRVTHRIVDISDSADGTVLVLKGDANADRDQTLYTVDEAYRYMFDVPVLGRVIAWLSTVPGIFVLAAYVAWMLNVAFRRQDRHDGGDTTAKDLDQPTDEPPSDADQGPARRTVGSRALRVVAGAGAIVIGAAVPAWAWSDAATISGSTLSTHTVAVQAQPTCQTLNEFLIGTYARLQWTKPDARYEYYYEVRRAATGVSIDSGQVGASTAAGGTVTLDIDTGWFSENGNFNVVIRARLTNATTWTSSGTTSTPIRRAIPLSMRCGHA